MAYAFFILFLVLNILPYYSISTQSRELIRGKIKYVVATNKKDCMFFSDKLKAMKKQKK